MSELPYIDDPEIFRKEIRRLIENRENGKLKAKRSYSLSKTDKEVIWSKTDGKCHICGKPVDVNSYEADHVKNHSSGGQDNVDNFLASCRTCNNYRWHYSSDEIQWILKLGVWAKTKIDHNDTIGKSISKEFIKKEIARENRRKIPRESLKTIVAQIVPKKKL